MNGDRAQLGILGAGQLGRMLALSARAMGVPVRALPLGSGGSLGSAGSAPASEHSAWPAADIIAGESALEHFCDGLSAATYEVEHIPLEWAEQVATRVPLRPSLAALEAGQDRLKEKALLGRFDLNPVRHQGCDSVESVRAAVEHVGLPAILKTRCQGYDGKGQTRFHDQAEVEAWCAGAPQVPGPGWVLEATLDFDREVSLIAVRSLAGDVRVYPATENAHRDGVLRVSTAPAVIAAAAWSRLTERVRALLEALDYVGVFTLELFQKGDDFFANEIAPRVHNSGHWTLDGAQTSQFENHVRAVLGWELGSCEALCPSAMVNLLGEVPSPASLLGDAGVHLHDYAKAPRVGRKVGHINILAPDTESLLQKLARVPVEVRGT